MSKMHSEVLWPHCSSFYQGSWEDSQKLSRPEVIPKDTFACEAQIHSRDSAIRY